MKKLILIILFCPTLLYSQWVQQTVPSNIDIVLCIDFINANTGVAGGWENITIVKGRAIYTTNSGINWIPAQIPDSSRSLVKSQFVNDNTGYIAGAYNTYYSYNSKYQSKSKDINQRFYLPTRAGKYHESIGMTGSLESYRGLFLKTTNGGQSWFTLDNLPANVYYLMGMCFINQNTGFVTASFNYSGGVLDGVLKTTDAGLSWNTLTSVDSVSLGNIFTPDGNIVVATGWKRISGFVTGGFMLKSSNGGINWTEHYFQNVDSFNDVCFLNSMTGFTVGDDTQYKGVIYKTTNTGSSWFRTHIVGDSCEYQGIKISSSGIGFTVGYLLDLSSYQAIPLISRTSNFGINWSNEILIDTGKILFSISTVNQNIWFICGGGFSGNGLILKTTNGGVGIQPISNEIPNKFSLYQNYPNPFNPSTKIRFDLHKTAHTKLIIFDALGRKVATLVDEELRVGSYEVDWNGSNYPSGVYFYRIAIHSDRLETREYSQTKKMLYLK